VARRARSPIRDEGDELRSAAAMMTAMISRDVEGIQVLGKYADTTGLVFGFAKLMIDALNEPATTNIQAYLNRLFERLER
jgi:hypothetical protein